MAGAMTMTVIMTLMICFHISQTDYTCKVTPIFPQPGVKTPPADSPPATRLRNIFVNFVAMEADKTIHMLEHAGIKPTSNRILVLRAILRSDMPLCLADLETELQTLEKSSVSRVLSLLQTHGVIHAIEDGRGITRYEPCCGDHCQGGDHKDNGSDLHAHFYCERCHRVYCFPTIQTPSVPLPEGFTTLSINYMLKGICPDCQNRR